VRPRSWLGRLLTLAALAAGSVALADTPTSITVSPSSGKASATVNFQATITNTVATPLNGVGFSLPLTGAQSVNSAGATSTCGGAFTASGQRLSFSGGTIPGNQNCTVSVPFQLPSAAASNTIQFPANTLVTDQGSTNQYGNTQTYTAVNVNLPVTTISDSGSTVTAAGTLRTYAITISNTDTADLRNVVYRYAPSAVQSINSGYGVTPKNFLVSCGDGSGGTATFTPGNTSGTFDLTLPLLKAKTTCTVSYQAQINADVVASPQQLNNRTVYGTDQGGNTVNALGYTPTLISNTSDTGLNGKSNTDLVQYAVQSSMNLTMNGGKVSDASGTSMTMRIHIDNRIARATRYTFTDPFPAFMTAVPSSTVSSPQNCDVSGVSYSGSTISFSNLVPASSVCDYDFVIPFPNPFPAAQKGTYQNNQLTAVTVDVPQGGAKPGASAYWRYVTEGTVHKYSVDPNRGPDEDSFVPSLTDGAWDIRLTNNTGTPLTNVSFTDILKPDDQGQGTAPIYEAAKSRSTCGGTLSAGPQANGRTPVTFSGGVVPANGTCDVYIAFYAVQFAGTVATRATLPNAYITDSNDTPVVSADNATFSPDNAKANTSTFVDTIRLAQYGTPYVSDTATLAAQYDNNTVEDAQVTLNVPFNNMFRLDPNGTGSLVCASYYSTQSTTTPLPASAFTTTATGASYSLSVKRVTQSTTDPTRPRVTINGYCAVNVPVIATAAGNATVFADPGTSNHSRYLTTAQYTVLARPNMNLNVSKVFNPTTVQAGETSAVTVRLSSDVSASISLNDSLPAGLHWVFTANQQDGSYQNAAYTTCSANPSGCTATPAAPALRYEADGVTVHTILTPTGGNVVDSLLLGNVRATNLGDLTNTIRASDLTSNTNYTLVSNAPASASLKVAPSVNVSKSFSPASIEINQTSTLTLKLENFNVSTDSLSVQDVLPAGLTVVTPYSSGGTCAGTSSYGAATRTISVSGAVLASGASCTYTTTVTSSMAGTYTNTIPAGSVKATNGTNPSAVSAVLTVTLPVFSGCLTADSAALSATTLSPGTAAFTRVLTNTGIGTLTASGSSTGLLFTRTLPTGYVGTYRFVGGPGAADPQAAWDAYVAANGGLAPGQSVQFNTTLVTPANQARGTAATDQIQATPGTPNCGVLTLSDTVTVIKGVAGTVKTQALCTLAPDGTPTCGTDSDAPLKVTPCSVIRYHVRSDNSGDAALNGVVLKDVFDANLRPLGVGARTSSNQRVLLSTDGGTTFTSYDPANPPSALISARNVQGAVDNGGGQPAALTPKQSLTLTLYGQVAGACTTPALAPTAPWAP